MSAETNKPEEENSRPEPNETVASPAPEPETPPVGGGKKSAGFLAVLFYLILLASVGFVAFLTLRHDQVLENLTVEQTRLQADNAAASQGLGVLQGTVRDAQTRLAEMEGQAAGLRELLARQGETLDELSAQLAATRLRINTTETGSNQLILLAEAESLVRLAQQRLVAAGDVRTAIALLVAGDDMLKSINDSAVFAIRDALAADLAALRAVPEVDVEGLFVRLGAVAGRVENLDLAGGIGQALETARGNAAAAADSPSQGWWTRTLDRLAETVTVHRLDEAIEPLPTAEQAYAVRQSIRLSLEQAQLALLQEQSIIYQDAISRAAMLIDQYLAGGDGEKQSILNALDDLQNTGISVQVPSLSGTLNAFRRAVAAYRTAEEDATN